MTGGTSANRLGVQGRDQTRVYTSPAAPFRIDLENFYCLLKCLGLQAVSKASRTEHGQSLKVCSKSTLD